MSNIEVVLSPALFAHRELQNDIITVVIDVLRATSSFNAVFDCGARSIYPVGDLDQLKALKQEGYYTAAERDGRKVEFADFGNSPLQFLQASLKDADLAYSTTNGTRSILSAKECGPVLTAAFTNLSMASGYLLQQHQQIVILCSGWKNNPGLEDTLCAGAIIEKLLHGRDYSLQGDAAVIALEMWQNQKNNIVEFCSHGAHYQRLLKAGLRDDLDHCFKMDVSGSLPVLSGNLLLPYGIHA